ncbi:MAG: histidine kinase dimerization/phosphoacceptor domain -containing protein [Salinibacter sp.]
MSLRRKIQLVVAGLGLGILVTGGASALVLWYVWTGVEPLLSDLPGAASLLRRSLWLVVGTTSALLLGAALAGRWLSSSLQTSLNLLRKAVEQVRTGRLDAQLSMNPDDELGRIAQSLNRMTTTLSQQTVSRTYLHGVLDSMAELLFVVEADGTVHHANEAAAAALGCTTADLRGTRLTDHFDEDPLSANGEGPVERTLTPAEGPTNPVLVSRSTLDGENAEGGSLVCVAQDISERKAAEQKLRRSLEEKEVLLREIHHRVKNNLQVISSLLHAQARDVESAAVQERFEETQERIRSMAAIHEQLYQSDDLSQVDFDAYLEELLEELFRSHATRRIERQLKAEAATLPIDQAIPAGLIVNELVSNALEHAFPQAAPGTVTVRFRVEGNEAALVVADDGQGGDAMDADGSLGLRLVRGLTRQLRGTLTTETDDGVTVTVTFPRNPSE